MFTEQCFQPISFFFLLFTALVSFDEFANAVVNSNGYPRPNEAQYNAFIQGLPKGLITTKQEAAMALTHFLHESDGLRAKREYRCESNGCPGEYVTGRLTVSEKKRMKLMKTVVIL